MAAGCMTLISAASTELDMSLVGTTNSHFGNESEPAAVFAKKIGIINSGTVRANRLFNEEVIKEGDMLAGLAFRFRRVGIVNKCNNKLIIPGSAPLQGPVAAAYYEQSFADTLVQTPMSGVGHAAAGRNVCARFCLFAPFYWVQYATWNVGNNDVDTVRTRHIVLFNDIFVKDSLKLHAGAMYGTEADRTRWSMYAAYHYVHLPFYFSGAGMEDYNDAYPFISASHSPCRLKWMFNDPLDTIENHNSLFSAFTVDEGPGAEAVSTVSVSNKILLPATSTSAPTLDDFTYDLMAYQVYLGEDERKTRRDEERENIVFMVHQSAEDVATLTSTKKSADVEVPFNFPCANFTVIAQSSLRAAANQRCNFTGYADAHTISAECPEGLPRPLLKSMSVKYNNNEQQAAMDAEWWTEQSQMLHCSAVSRYNHYFHHANHLYNPYDGHSGSANASRLNKVVLPVQAADDAFVNDGLMLDRSADQISISVYSLAYNTADLVDKTWTPNFAS